MRGEVVVRGRGATCCVALISELLSIMVPDARTSKFVICAADISRLMSTASASPTFNIRFE